MGAHGAHGAHWAPTPPPLGPMGPPGFSASPARLKSPHCSSIFVDSHDLFMFAFIFAFVTFAIFWLKC